MKTESPTILLRALAAAATLLALTRGLPPTSAQASERAEPVRIEVPLFEGGEGLDVFLEIARAYEKQRPGVEVNLYGDPRIDTKVRVRILEGTYPELTNAPLDYWPLIRAGRILPLDEFLDGPNWEGDGTWRDSFLPGSLDYFTSEGKTYGVPLGYSVSAIWYNKAMFEQHGWTPPATWSEFFALCEAIKAEDIAPLAFQGRYPGYAHMLIASAYYHLAGPEAFEAQNELEPGCFANPEFEQALELVQKTGFEYFQPGAMGMSHTEAQLQFFLGHTAMVACGSWLKSEMMGKIPEGFRLGTFNFPVVPAGKADATALGVGSGYFLIMKDSGNPRQAVDFLRFMTSRQMAATFCRRRDIPVAVRGVSEDNLSEDLHDLAGMIGAARTTYGPSRHMKVMQQHWSDACFNLLKRKPMTPKQVADELERQAAGIRSRWDNPDKVTVRHIWKPVALLAVLASGPVFLVTSAIVRARAKRRRKRRLLLAASARLNWRAILTFIGPAAVLYTVFVVVPCLKSFAWSVYRWDGLTEMTYKGLLHFKRLLFESDGFWIALRNNLFLMFVIPLCVLPLSLFLAACISRGVRGSKVFRIVVLFPNILGVVAATLLWMHMFNPQGGVVNRALVGIGLEGFKDFAWLSPQYLYWALIPISVWGACGFFTILFLAAMERIPASLYEAAAIDGASPWRQFWTITLPLMRDVLAIAAVFMVIGGMKAFEVIWLLTNQFPTTHTHVIGTRMVQSMFTEFKVGEATAIAVLLFLMVFYGTAVTLRLIRREKVEF